MPSLTIENLCALPISMLAPQLNPAISHQLEHIDPLLDATRNEPHRMECVRDLLERASETYAGLCDASCDNSIGAILSPNRSATHGVQALRMLLDPDAPQKARVCLLATCNKVIDTDEADNLDSTERGKCIAIRSTNQLALPVPPERLEPPRLLVTILKNDIGGTRDAKIDVCKLGETAVCLNTISSIGIRKKLSVDNLPRHVVDQLFAPAETPMPVASAVPRRRSDLPDYIRSAVAEFLERTLRLQVLCTASIPGPTTRPVVLDSLVMQQIDPAKKKRLSISGTLHETSSSCICGAHGLRFGCKGRVDVRVETCGRELEKFGNCLRCPCHVSGVDEHGNSRLNFNRICTEGTCITVTCFHSQFGSRKRGVCIDSLMMGEAERSELSRILVNVAEYYVRSVPFFDDHGWLAKHDELACLVDVMAEKLRASVEEVGETHSEREDAGDDHDYAEMCRRDATCVNLLREGGVFRHVYKSGKNRGHPYLQRHKKDDKTQPLKPSESGIVDTHGHLFRRS